MKTIQPITDPNAAVPEYFAHDIVGLSIIDFTPKSLFRARPIDHPQVTKIWPVSRWDYENRDHLSKVVSADGVLTLSFVGTARHSDLNDHADGQPANNRHQWFHIYEQHRLINELRADAGLDEQFELEADALYRELHATAVHCIINAADDFTTHIWHNDRKSKHAEEMADRVFGILVPKDANGRADWSALQTPAHGSYTLPSNMRNDWKKVIAALEGLTDLHTKTPEDVVREALWTALPRYAPVVTVTINKTGAQLTAALSLAGVKGTAETQWQTFDAEDEEWLDVGEGTGLSVWGLEEHIYRLKVSGLTDTLGEAVVRFSDEVVV